MNRSLYTKLVLIMLLLIVSLMAIVGAFLVRGIRSFYLNDFYEQMQSVFANAELADDLRSAAEGRDGAAQLAEILRAYSGQLGIDSRSRNYYVLSGDTGAFLRGSDPASGASLAVTPNILTALAGSEGYRSDSSAGYMDVALPIADGAGGSLIVYIRDNRGTMQSLTDEMLRTLLVALCAGLIISAGLSLLLAKTMVTPIQSLTHAAERVAGGDFSERLDSDARDEIGTLTRTFNDMAGQLETTLDNLRRSEQTRREFVANVSHELRTPITSIRSYAETLEETPDMPRDMEKNFLGVIVNESDRMANIVQDLLTLSRFDAGSIEFSFSRFPFESSVKNVHSAMLMEAQRRRQSFTLEFKGPLPDIRGDQARIEQIIMNMVSNALKYTPEGGRIRMRAGTDGDCVWLSVQDNGIGIPAGDVDKVFDRFYRVDKARSRESGGTGLGLSIAREIAQRHNGSLTLKSRPGAGTTITLSLPVGGPGHE